MPVLANPRWERFCHAIVAGQSDESGKAWTQSGAYRAAGYETRPGNSSEAAASRLLSKVKPIARRIAELQREVARRKRVTVESIVEELEEARGIAANEKQASAMVAATTSKAKVLGLQVERSEVGKPGDFSGAQSSAELVEGVLRSLGARAVSDVMRQLALVEMERHAAALAAIVAGEQQTDASVSS